MEKRYHTVELYEVAKSFSESIGYQVREENLGGIGGGSCLVAGKKCLFIDVTLSSVDQLDQIIAVVSQDPAIYVSDIPSELKPLIELPRAA